MAGHGSWMGSAQDAGQYDGWAFADWRNLSACLACPGAYLEKHLELTRAQQEQYVKTFCRALAAGGQGVQAVSAMQDLVNFSLTSKACLMVDLTESFCPAYKDASLAQVFLQHTLQQVQQQVQQPQQQGMPIPSHWMRFTLVQMPKTTPEELFEGYTLVAGSGWLGSATLATDGVHRWLCDSVLPDGFVDQLVSRGGTVLQRVWLDPLASGWCDALGLTGIPQLYTNRNDPQQPAALLEELRVVEVYAQFGIYNHSDATRKDRPLWHMFQCELRSQPVCKGPFLSSAVYGWGFVEGRAQGGDSRALAGKVHVVLWDGPYEPHQLPAHYELAAAEERGRSKALVERVRAAHMQEPIAGISLIAAPTRTSDELRGRVDAAPLVAAWLRGATTGKGMATEFFFKPTPGSTGHPPVLTYSNTVAAVGATFRTGRKWARMGINALEKLGRRLKVASAVSVSRGPGYSEVQLTPADTLLTAVKRLARHSVWLGHGGPDNDTNGAGAHQ